MAHNKSRSFLQGRQWSDNLRDFVYDAINDDNLPDAESWQQLENYLSEHDAPKRTLQAARYIWDLYEQGRYDAG